MNVNVSRRIADKHINQHFSHLVTAFNELSSEIDKGSTNRQFGRVAEISCGDTVINSDELDFEFDIDFDDDTEADEAEITVYNLSNRTINQLKINTKITVTAGYKGDTGIIFSGFITSSKSYYDDVDRITEIHAVDDLKRVEREIESISYSANTKASKILRDLCGKVGLPIAVFKPVRDYTFTDDVTVDGDLADKIKDYADICGVSAYVCKSKIYVRSLKDGDRTEFTLSADTGLLKVSEYEGKRKTKEYGEETLKGYDIEMLLQHRLQTASIINLNSQNYKGVFRVLEGSHHFSGDNFITKARIINV